MQNIVDFNPITIGTRMANYERMLDNEFAERYAFFTAALDGHFLKKGQ